MCLAIVWGTASVAEAQQATADQAPGDQAQTSNEAIGEPTKDLGDIIRDLRHKPSPAPPGPEDYQRRMVAAAPVVTYNPTSGFGVGLAGNVAYYKGSPDTTRISSLVGSVIGTSKKQLLVNGKISQWSLENRWRFEGDNRLYWTSQKTYGLGSDTLEENAVDQKYDAFRFYQTLYGRVGRDIYVGAGFLYNIHRDVRPADEGANTAWANSPYVAYSEKYGFDPASQTSAGFSARALFDSRDNTINPSRGWYANASYLMFFEGFLGGTSSWQQFSYDMRWYVPLTSARHKLAIWQSGDFVTKGVAPYLDLPATGLDTYGRSGRGYPQGRFRGEDLVYGEAEYRWIATRNGLLGMVAFLNTQTLSSEETGKSLFDSFAVGGGVGFRLMLNKHSKTNLCFDIGWGKDGRAAYFAVQEAF